MSEAAMLDYVHMDISEKTFNQVQLNHTEFLLVPKTSASKGLPLDCRATRLNLKSQPVELPRPQPQDGVCSRTNKTFYPCCRVYRPSRNLAEDRQDSPVVLDAVAIKAAGF